MGTEWLAAPLKLVTRAYREDGRPNIAVLASALGVCAIQIIAVLIAAQVDHTWRLKDDGLGLLRHYGAWAILIGDPLLILAAGYAHHRFRITFSSLPVAGSRERSRLHALLRRYLAWVEAREFGVFAYILCLALGLVFWWANVQQTENPYIVFRHDVFDAPPHNVGFLVYKFCLFTSWVIVYPIVGYVITTLSFSASAILSVCRRERLLRPHVAHPDNCFGLRKVGMLSISLITPYLISYGVALSLWSVHHHLYTTVSVALVTLTTLIFLTSYFVFLPTYRLFHEARSATYQRLLGHAAGEREPGEEHDLNFAIERLCFGSTDASPYSRPVEVIVVIMNLTPIAGLISFLGRYFAFA